MSEPTEAEIEEIAQFIFSLRPGSGKSVEETQCFCRELARAVLSSPPIVKMRALNAELVEALEKIIYAEGANTCVLVPASACEKARAILAKVNK